MRFSMGKYVFVFQYGSSTSLFVTEVVARTEFFSCYLPPISAIFSSMKQQCNEKGYTLHIDVEASTENKWTVGFKRVIIDMISG